MARLLETRRAAPVAAVLAAAVLAAGCGQEGIELAESDPGYEAAVLFNENCGMCHTLDVAASEGSSTDANDAERVDGPNFNQRREDVQAVLYAIRNGGFSGAIMPENILTGGDAQRVAEFLARYAGQDTPSGSGGG
ncbi:MAG: cytochrome c [Solirubrobacteraceae bacterium MAG38_C4-C5]|nr:cytochrome c [Candidatus Siliceabacter maunaloa]